MPCLAGEHLGWVEVRVHGFRAWGSGLRGVACRGYKGNPKSKTPDPKPTLNAKMLYTLETPNRNEDLIKPYEPTIMKA